MAKTRTTDNGSSSTMATPRIACQTYTWQMSGDTYVGRLDHIIEVLGRDTGFAGVESETQFLGRLGDPAQMSAALADAGIELAAMTLVEDWLGGSETVDEQRRADECIAFLEHFPGTLLNLCQMPTSRPENHTELRSRQRNLLECVRAVAARATELGIVCGYHPNSPESSIYRTADDYRVLLDGLDQRLGWIPDCGHIARVGMDPLEWIRDYRSLVRHVHYKDMAADGSWQEMGNGRIDYVAITNELVSSGYDGWIVVEDESDRAIPEPDDVTQVGWNWIERELVPLLAAR